MEQPKALLHTIALMVAADHDGLENELSVARSIWADASPEWLHAEALKALVQRVERSPKEVWRELQQHTQALDASDRETLMRAAIRVAMADSDLDDRETRVLGQLAHLLQIPLAKVRKLMNAVFHEENG